MQKSLFKKSIDTSSVQLPESQIHSLSMFSTATKFTPLDGSDFFDQTLTIPSKDDQMSFQVYRAGIEHSLVLILLHGCGYSALSWACSAKRLKKDFQLMAFDMRAHGQTHCKDESNERDLSLETLCNDVMSLIESIWGETLPSIILVGHSLGGAIAIQLAASGRLASILKGLIVLDVVEGTAIEALNNIEYVLKDRPTRFDNLEQAINWSFRKRIVKNLESARVSTQGSLIQQTVNDDQKQEQQDEEETTSKSEYVWRTDIIGAKEHWLGWFTGMSTKFLSCRIPKFLILAGTDRLDKELTIGQMQGKFQLQLVASCGHNIQEDDPDKVAFLITDFIKRFRLDK